MKKIGNLTKRELIIVISVIVLTLFTLGFTAISLLNDTEQEGDTVYNNNKVQEIENTNLAIGEEEVIEEYSEENSGQIDEGYEPQGNTIVGYVDNNVTKTYTNCGVSFTYDASKFNYFTGAYRQYFDTASGGEARIQRSSNNVVLEEVNVECTQGSNLSDKNTHEDILIGLVERWANEGQNYTLKTVDVARKIGGYTYYVADITFYSEAVGTQKERVYLHASEKLFIVRVISDASYDDTLFRAGLKFAGVEYTNPSLKMNKYTATGVEYSPDSSKYAGYQVCDDATSTCKVYGIPYDLIANFFQGKIYKISFTDYACNSAAAGTTYCVVTSPYYEVEITPL